MNTLQFYFIAILFAFCQADKEVFQAVQDDIQNTVTWINNEGSLIKDALKTDVVDYKKNIKINIEDKISRLESLFDSALKDVDRLPQNCKGNIRGTLEILKSSSVSDFLHCPALLPGLVDILDIFDMTVELVFDVVVTTGDVIKSLFGCLANIWPWQIASCWKNDVQNNFDQIIEQARLYRSAVGEYADNFTMTMEWCWRNSSAVEDIISIVTPVYQCAGQKVPVNIYHL